MRSNFTLKSLTIISVIALLIMFMGCQQRPDEAAVPDIELELEPDISHAIAVLHPTKGNDVSGIVRFTRLENGIQVVADVTGLKPGPHGFHIHQYGDCSEPDATSAGGHFAPDGNPHGAPTDVKRHVGDLGNIVADQNGNAHMDWVDAHITFDGMHSIIGRAVVVHASEDDFTTQPTGNAGPRVACGVIGITE